VTSPAYRLAFEDRPGHLHVLVTGDKDSFETTMAAVTEIAGVCLARRVTKLLVEHDISGKLSTLDVFKIASRLPDLYQGVHVAFVVHQAQIPDNPEFLENVARNRGAQGRLFADAREAEAWLSTF
jgi:hypothetical protein